MHSLTRDERPQRQSRLPMSRQRERAAPAGAPPVGPLLAHQRALGNQAVQRFAASRPLALPAPALHQRLQPKLRIGSANGPAEREADLIANQVMGMPARGVPERSPNPCPPAGGDTTLRRVGNADDGEELLQPRRTGDPVLPATAERDLGAARGSGRPLPGHLRDFYQARMGADLGAVTVHTGRNAAALAQDLGAQAFTSGQDIFFGAGEWSPTTDRGRWLLAHELAHTLQSDRGLVVHRQTPPPTKSAPASPTTRLSAPAPKSAAPAKKPSSAKTTPAPATPKGPTKDLHVFVYDVGDKVLEDIWKASAESFAASVDGIAVQSGASTAATLDNVVQALDKNRTKYGCLRSIEFFGHGAPGAALTTGHGPLKEADIPAAAAKATALVGSHSGPNVTLHKNFDRLRRALCNSSYLHFRTCETFKGPQGAKFASRLAKYLGKSYLIGHTKVIDVNLPGREVYDPTGKKMKPTARMPAGLLPPKQPASKLPVQHFRIEVDLSGLGKGLGKGKAQSLPDPASFLLAGRSTVLLSAQVLDHSDAEKYLLRALLLAPHQVSLSSLATVIPALVPPGTAPGPTVPLITAKDDALDVPIGRRFVERIARLRVLTFPYTTDFGTVKIKITGASEGPGTIARAGGFELGAGALYSPAFAKSVLGIASIQLPLTGFGPSVKGVPINLFRLHTGAEALFGDKTAVGRLNLGLRVDLETLRVDLGVFTGGGLYRGRPDWMVGGGAGLGTKLGNFTVDAGWQMFFTGEGGKERNHAGFLKLGWRFE